MLSRIALRRGTTVALVGLLAFALNAGIALLVRMPVPTVHDEFGYLLEADTFAHGRLTNPTHPLWVHFESFHIFFQPTYTALYPPGQGMLLAVGQIISGRPIVGAWLASALACGAICWMLMGWTRPQWALIGGVLALTHTSTLEWGQSYMGGSVAVVGGALVVGAWRRIVRLPQTRHAFVLGVGMFILANTRPYEGMVLSLIAIVGLVFWIIKSARHRAREIWSHLGIPLVGMALLAIIAAGYYNWRVTNNVFRMPWAHGQRIYGGSPAFFWQSRKAGWQYRHAVMRDFFLGWELERYQRQRTPSGFLKTMTEKVWFYFRKFLRPAPIAVFFIAALWSIRHDRWTRWALIGFLIYLTAVLLNIDSATRYFAAAFPIVFILAVFGLRHLRSCQPHLRYGGKFFVRALLLLCVLYPVIWCVRGELKHDVSWAEERARLLDRLHHDGGKHLILVRYAPQHSPHNEWVYNEADIDAAKVVWAREMDAALNRELLEYYKDRHIWLLEPDAKPIQLQPYPQAAAAPN